MTVLADEVGNPLLRKGGSQALRQTCWCLFSDSAGRSRATIYDRDSRGGLRNPQHDAIALFVSCPPPRGT